MNMFEVFSKQNEILRFIVPPFVRSRVVLSVDNILIQSYYHSYECPGYVFMREEYQLPSPSYLTCILEAVGRNLTVLSYIEHNQSEITVFNQGYEYIRLPTSVGCTENWDYNLNDQLRVNCISKLTTRKIDGLTCKELQVERQTIYSDGMTYSVSFTREYYVAGIGITGIEYGKEQKK